jgi:hypothetical protein
MGFILTSCYEEPIIEPVKRPYSSVRVGNFSYNQPGFAGNIDQFEVYVDGVLKGNVAVNTFTNYFDLPSGNRRFLLKNGADVIYDANVTITSFAEISLIFDGVYAPGVDTLMSFAPYTIEDGIVYILEAPPAGKANLYVTNTAPNTDKKNQIKYSLAFTSSGFDTTLGAGPFGYNETVGIQIPQGDYTVHLLFDKTTDPSAIGRSYDTLKVFNTIETFTAGMKENLFIVGIPDSTEELVKDTQSPLPVRPK